MALVSMILRSIFLIIYFTLSTCLFFPTNKYLSNFNVKNGNYYSNLFHHNINFKVTELKSSIDQDKYKNSYKKADKYNIRKQNFPPGSMAEFNFGVEKLQEYKYYNDMDAFTKTLKTLASTTFAYDVDVPTVLLPIFNDWSYQLGPEQLSDWIWSLGKLGFKVFQASQRPICMDLLQRLCITDGLTARQVTTAFGGLSKIGIKWNNLVPKVKQDMLNILESICYSLNDREIGNILHSLCKIGILWSYMSIETQKGLMENFVLHSKSLLCQQGSMSVYSLGLLGLDIKQLDPIVKDTIYNVSLAVINEIGSSNIRYHSQQSSNVIYGLAKLGVQLYEIPPYVVESIQNSLLLIMRTMNEQEVANTVYSLGIMGAKWSTLLPELKDIIQHETTLKFQRMIPQGVSNTIYGLGIMECKWSEMSIDSQNSIYDVIITCFKPSNLQPSINSQAVANVIYALGLFEVDFELFPVAVQNALIQGLVLCAPYLKSQEISNVFYGLGLMKAKFYELPEDAQNAMTYCFQKFSKEDMNEQEVCSILHGLAKMDAKWDTMSETLKNAIVKCSIERLELGTLCLACTVYSLGLYGVIWEDLPPILGDNIGRTALATPLADQTISNTIYGLGLMQANWDTLNPLLKEALLDNLGRKDVFKDDFPMHLSNVFWSLSKMDASWSDLPIENIEESLLRCTEKFQHQETSNTLYGLALMDASWNNLSLSIILALERTLFSTINGFTIQEMANCMYSLAIMTFDAEGINELQKKPKKKASSSLVISDQEQKLISLWKINKLIIDTFQSLDSNSFEKENYDQFAIFFELMDALPQGKKLVKEVFATPPQPSGPSGTIPSRLHALTVQAMIEQLWQLLGNKFSIFNEFNGLHGVFPIDTAVYHKNKLIALVEIDGEFHYKSLGQQLRRKDQLKEYLYRHKFPNIAFYRMRSDHIYTIGTSNAGVALGNWIAKDFISNQ